MLKKIIKGLLLIGLIISIEQFCHSKTWGFRRYKIESNLSYNPKFENPEIENIEALNKMLDQPFRLMGKGNQSFVFASQDNLFVIKFFKHHHMNPNHFLNKFHFWGPLEVWRKNFTTKQKERLDYTFTSCRIAYDLLREETGLIYTHLNKTKSLFNKEITIIDPSGAKHFIDLDSTEFVLQKKAEMVITAINALAKKGSFDEIKIRILSYLDLIEKRSRLGVRDEDSSFYKNYGFIADRAITIDLGSFVIDSTLKDPQVAKESFRKEVVKLRLWIEKMHPELTFFLDEEIKRRL